MKTLLIPTDFSDNSLPAMKLALMSSAKTGLQPIFLHIASAPKPNQTEQQIVEQASAQLNASLSQLAGQAGVSIAANAKLVVKINFLVHETIVQTALDYKAELILMGSHGSSGLERLLLGSNAVGVIEKSPIPVMVIPMHYQAKPIRRIAYASDLLDPESELDMVASLAKTFGSGLDIFHVFPVYPEEVKIEKFDNQGFIDKVKQLTDIEDVQLYFIPTSRPNQTTEGIGLFIKCYKPDLVAMFMRKRGWFDKIFDTSKTEALVFESAIPLVALKTKE
jgi:nucleotide-binding universal stress UspA family protein